MCLLLDSQRVTSCGRALVFRWTSRQQDCLPFAQPPPLPSSSSDGISYFLALKSLTCTPSPPSQPKLVEDAALASETVTKVAAGSRHTLVLCATGRAFAFGWGAFGQLGSGQFASARRPQAVAVPGGAQVADLAAGWWHSLFHTP